MADLFPQEIMVEILQRLRVKDLVCYRCVSKQWLSIIDDPYFIRSQHRHSLSTYSNSALFLQDRKSTRVLYWRLQRNAIANASDDINNSFLSSEPVYYEPTETGKLQLMGSSHGLVCFSLCNRPHPDFLIVNPSTGERHTLTNPISDPSLSDPPLSDRPLRIRKSKIAVTNYKLKAYGFGYDELSDDYKVVRILQRSYNSYIAEIYGLRSKGFVRTIPLPNADWNYFNNKFTGVFIGGSLHWCTWNPVRQPVIHAIDLVSNTYRQLDMPEYSFGRSCSLNVGIVGRSLCVCGYFKRERKMGIWVMEEYGNPESWKMICSFKNVIEWWWDRSSVTSVGNDGDKILLMVNWCRFIWYDPTTADETGISKVCKDLGREPHEAMFCSDSLVKIFPNVMKKFS